MKANGQAYCLIRWKGKTLNLTPFTLNPKFVPLRHELWWLMSFKTLLPSYVHRSLEKDKTPDEITHSSLRRPSFKESLFPNREGLSKFK
jgi:hypothetical protein